MSASLVPTSGRIADQIELARTMATASLLPKQYQQNPGNLLWAIQYAEALQVHPMTAITGIHVIEGKPTASAQLIGGLVRRAGHKLRVTFDKATMTAHAVIIRCDDPEFSFESKWSFERAKTAKLTGKSVWQAYPEAMLKARAITEVARDACPEALFGVIYTAEELGTDGTVTDDGEFVPVVTRVQTSAPTGIPRAEAVAQVIAAVSGDVNAAGDVWRMAGLPGTSAGSVTAEELTRALALAADSAAVDAELVEEVQDDELPGEEFPEADVA